MRKRFTQIGSVRIDLNIITAYYPLWTEGRITSIALKVDGSTETIRAAVEHAEALDILDMLDEKITRR